VNLGGTKWLKVGELNSLLSEFGSKEPPFCWFDDLSFIACIVLLGCWKGKSERGAGASILKPDGRKETNGG
jgi:hypothetical protein